MPVVDRVVESLDAIKSTKNIDLIITDGDDTIFPHGSTEPYIDCLEYLQYMNPRQLILVSGNPDSDLAMERASIIGATQYFTPDKRPKWLKYGLFMEACQYALLSHEPVQEAVVLGNRWCMDIAVAKLALASQNIHNVEGILVNRNPDHRENFDRFLVDPIQYVGAAALKKAGLDEHVRPRRSSQLPG
jgi:hypothetical protein